MQTPTHQPSTHPSVQSTHSYKSTSFPHSTCLARMIPVKKACTSTQQSHADAPLGTLTSNKANQVFETVTSVIAGYIGCWGLHKLRCTSKACKNAIDGLITPLQSRVIEEYPNHAQEICGMQSPGMLLLWRTIAEMVCYWAHAPPVQISGITQFSQVKAVNRITVHECTEEQTYRATNHFLRVLAGRPALKDGTQITASTLPSIVIDRLQVYDMGENGSLDVWTTKTGENTTVELKFTFGIPQFIKPLLASILYEPIKHSLDRCKTLFTHDKLDIADAIWTLPELVKCLSVDREQQRLILSSPNQRGTLDCDPFLLPDSRDPKSYTREHLDQLILAESDALAMSFSLLLFGSLGDAYNNPMQHNRNGLISYTREFKHGSQKLTVFLQKTQSDPSHIFWKAWTGVANSLLGGD